MRILYVAQNYLPEMGAGPGRISEMAREWVRAGHEVEVLAPVPNHPTGVVPPEFRGRALFRETDAHGVAVTRTWIYTAANRGLVRRSLAFASFAAAAVVAGTAVLARPDVVIGSSPQLLAAVAGAFVGELRRVPWVFEVRDLWPESVIAVGAMSPESPVVRALFGIADSMYTRAGHIVVVTHSFRDILRARGVTNERISVVPNGVDLDRFVPQSPRAEDRAAMGGDARFVVSYLGTHGMAHDLGRLLDVAGRMKDRTDVAFAFVGDGAERAALEQRAKHERLGNVRFLGVQPRERMPALYAASDLCVVPLRKSDVFTTVLPSKVFEIMAMAKPIVLAVDGEVRQVVEQSGAGRFVPPGDSGALHATIGEMLTDPGDLAQRGQRGREFVAREYDRRAIAARYLEVLKRVVARRR